MLLTKYFLFLYVGYDTLQQIFMARGPSFQKGKVVEHFSNLEIYNLLASKSSSGLLFLFYLVHHFPPLSLFHCIMLHLENISHTAG